MPRADSTTSPPEMVEVIKTEEKGSDVNLATYLLKDGYENDYEAAAVISNDSDLMEPIRVVKENLGKPVTVLSPFKEPSVGLQRIVGFIKPIRKGVLRVSQFPRVMRDGRGRFYKPEDW